MQKINASISCNLDPNILLTSLPLFETEKVDAIEWSFDTLFKIKDIPGWFSELLQTFSHAGKLTGHGVYFSLFSGRWSKEQQAWLTQLKNLSVAFQFDHITEHFGFMTGENFHTGAPLSIPFTPQTLAIGQDRLKRIYYACNCPVGLENLAFAYTLEDVQKHGDFLQQLLEQRAVKNLIRARQYAGEMRVVLFDVPDRFVDLLTDVLAFRQVQQMIIPRIRRQVDDALRVISAWLSDSR